MQSREVTKADSVWDVSRVLRRIMSDRTGRYCSADWKEPHLVGMDEVMRAVGHHVRDSLVNGRGVHIRGFGTFTFSKRRRPSTAPAGRFGNNNNNNINNNGSGSGSNSSTGHETCAEFEVRPLFKVDEAVLKVCKVKEAAEVPRIPRFSGSIYEAVPTAMYLNPVTVASRCGRSPRFVRAVVDDFFTCVADLIRATVPQVLRLDFHFGTFNFDTATRVCVFKFTPAFRRALEGLNASARHSNLHRSSYEHHVALNRGEALETTRRLRTPNVQRLTPVSGRASVDPALGMSMTGLANPKWARGVPLERELPELATTRSHRPSSVRSRSARGGVGTAAFGGETARSFNSRIGHIERMRMTRTRPTTAA